VLIIRKEQMHALSLEAERLNEQRLATFFAEEYPTQAAEMGGDGLLGLIRKARIAGKKYRIETAGAVAVWTELWIQFGEDLRRSPERRWAERILSHQSLPDYTRVEQVRDRLTRLTGGRVVVAAVSQSGD